MCELRTHIYYVLMVCFLTIKLGFRPFFINTGLHFVKIFNQKYVFSKVFEETLGYTLTPWWTKSSSTSIYTYFQTNFWTVCIFVTPHRSRIFELTPTFSKNTVKVLWLLFFYNVYHIRNIIFKSTPKKIIYRGSTHSAVWFYLVNEPKPNYASHIFTVFTLILKVWFWNFFGPIFHTMRGPPVHHTRQKPN